MTIDGNQVIVEDQVFNYSQIFRADTNQISFFNDTLQKRVKKFINGDNFLIFSYGVTNSGKTYTKTKITLALFPLLLTVFSWN
jgi:hypothetical protein